MMLVAAAVVAVTVIAALQFLPRSTTTTNPGPSAITGAIAPAGSGTLVIDAVPWARIERILNAKGEEQKLPDTSTPLALQLPAGDYRIEISGPPPSGARREIAVTVGANVTRVAPVVTFAEMSVEDYFRSQTAVVR